MAISRRNTTAKCLLTRVGCYNIRKQRKGYVNNFFLYLRKKRDEGRRLIFDSTSCQYGEALCKIRQFLPLVSSNVTLFVLKALNWETNVGYTVNAFFSGHFPKVKQKSFFNIIQGSLNVYPEQVKLRIGFWKLLIYSCSTEVECLKYDLTISRPFLLTYIEHDSCPLCSTLLRFWLVSPNVRLFLTGADVHWS